MFLPLDRPLKRQRHRNDALSTSLQRLVQPIANFAVSVVRLLFLVPLGTAIVEGLTQRRAAPSLLPAPTLAHPLHIAPPLPFSPSSWLAPRSTPRSSILVRKGSSGVVLGRTRRLGRHELDDAESTWSPSKRQVETRHRMVYASPARRQHVDRPRHTLTHSRSRIVWSGSTCSPDPHPIPTPTQIRRLVWLDTEGQLNRFARTQPWRSGDSLQEMVRSMQARLDRRSPLLRWHVNHNLAPSSSLVVVGNTTLESHRKCLELKEAIMEVSQRCLPSAP